MITRKDVKKVIDELKAEADKAEKDMVECDGSVGEYLALWKAIDKLNALLG